MRQEPPGNALIRFSPPKRSGGLAFIVALASVMGCSRDADSVRDALTARESSWTRRLTTLRSEHAALKLRVENLAASPNQPPGRDAQIRAAVSGVGQSLTDIEAQARQVRPSVEQATGQGAAAAGKALDGASARMNEYFEALTSDLASASRAIDEAGKQE